MPSRFYTVQSGDTTAKVAKKHEIALADLLLANNLDRHTTIKPRQTLRIPRPGEMVAVKAPAAATPPPLMLAKAEPPLEKPVKGINPETSAAKKTAALQVQPKLSKTTAAEPALVDSVAPAARKPKVVAAAPEESRPNFEIVIADVQLEPLGKVQGMPMGQIQVEIEETLGHYGEWAAVPTQKIRAVNGLRFGQTVQLGRKLKIPLTRRTAREFAEQRYEFHKRLQDDFLAVYRVGQPQPYQVQAGDNIWNLCRDKFEIPMWLLKHCNPDVDLSQLALQQTLLIPTIEKTSGDEPGIGAPDGEGTGVGK
ncbi:MAG: LysM peptidoglycan-binding domain-containing protein [Chrysiogenales bacterium]